MMILRLNTRRLAYQLPSAGNSYKPFFRLSTAQRSHHAFIRSRLFALPTLTVGMTFSMRRAQQNMVSSRKLECSLYGTPKQLARLPDPR